jgi:hypothetical protein
LGLLLGAYIMREIIISTTAAVTLFSSAALPQQAAQGTASIPDFSGVWAHPSAQSGFEPLSSGPRPVTGLLRREGVSDFYQYVGDYTNPILKSEASQVVKKYGEIEISGLASSPDPKQQLLAVGCALHFFFNLACRYCSYRTRSRSFTSGIMNSVKCT